MTQQPVDNRVSWLQTNTIFRDLPEALVSAIALTK